MCGKTVFAGQSRAHSILIAKASKKLLLAIFTQIRFVFLSNKKLFQRFDKSMILYVFQYAEKSVLRMVVHLFPSLFPIDSFNFYEYRYEYQIIEVENVI